MKEVFLSLFVVAAIASGVGMAGVYVSGWDDVRQALLSLQGAPPGTQGPLLGALENPADPTQSALPFATPSAEEYRHFREQRFSEEVDALIVASCPPTQVDLRGCVRTTQARLTDLYRERAARAGLFDGLLLGGRILFGAAGLVSLVWLGLGVLRVTGKPEEDGVVEPSGDAESKS